MGEERVKKHSVAEKNVRNASLIFYGLVFGLWYGVPLLKINGMEMAMEGGEGYNDEEKNMAESFMKGMIFPISYIGLGTKIARIGLEDKGSSIGALMVVWAGQSVA